jgi:hypothetical protein
MPLTKRVEDRRDSYSKKQKFQKSGEADFANVQFL